MPSLMKFFFFLLRNFTYEVDFVLFNVNQNFLIANFESIEDRKAKKTSFICVI